MRFTFIILLVITTTVSFGQDSLQNDQTSLQQNQDSLKKDSTSKSSKSYVTKTTKKRKKSKQPKREDTSNIKETTVTNANNTAEHHSSNITSYVALILFVLSLVAIFVGKHLIFEANRRRRRDYYRDVYLKSDEWQRKRQLVLRRDNWRCVYCGAPATQVHHKKYARRNIGKEPIDWLVSVCKKCHDAQHQ